jgi:hypothetical protein
MPRGISASGKSRARGDWKLYAIYEVVDEKGQPLPNARARFVRVEKDKASLLEKVGQGTLKEKFMVVVVPMGDKGQLGEARIEDQGQATPEKIKAVA